MNLSDPTKIKFFILGAPRSGTSLLNSILNSHRSIFTIPPTLKNFEFSGIIRLYKNTGHGSDWEERWGDALGCWDKGARAFMDVAYGELLKKYNFYSKEIIGIKTPYHVFYLKEISRLFPEAKFIYLYRDGRDAAISMKRTFPKKYPVFSYAFYIWGKCNRAVLSSELFKEKKDKFLMVSYESLCQNTAHEMKKIAIHLGVSNSFDVSVFKPHSSSVGVWKRKLYPWQRFHVGLQSKTLKELGYL